MTTAREDVVAYLRDKLPEVKVLDTVEALTNLQRAAVMVARSAIAHPPDNTAEQRDDELTVWLVSPHLDIGKAEADLDESLDELLAVIDAHEFLHWTAGERGMFNDEWHGFRLTVPHRTVTTEE
jgi:hypothetical protein